MKDNHIVYYHPAAFVMVWSAILGYTGLSKNPVLWPFLIYATYISDLKNKD